jgi:hypothetical protein
MSTFSRRLGLGSVVLLGLLAAPHTARAQYAYGYTPFGLNLTNPYLANRNYMYNLQLSRAAFANSLAFSPPGLAFPRNVPAYNPYLGFGVNPYLASGLGGVNPYSPYGLSNPYSAGGYGGGAYDPYLSGMSNPYMYGMGYGGGQSGASTGFSLMGASDVLRSYGSMLTSTEQARILREQVNQARLETRKKAFDLDAYIRNNTPTFTEEQAKVTRNTLKRIQTNSNPAEVTSGRALNFLLDDIRAHRGKTFTMTPIPLDDYVLKHVNITTRNYGLGLLRDGGKLSWPVALQELTTDPQRKDLQARAERIAQNAIKGERDANALKDLRTEVEQIRADLLKRTNDIPTDQYLEAKRFLNDLDDARMAIEAGEAPIQADFQRLALDGKLATLNDLIGVMVERGWRFAPALRVDESAYRALHSALAAYDVALNSQAPTTAEAKE